MPVDAFIYFEEQAGMLALNGDRSRDGFDFSQTTPDGTLATTVSKTMDMASTPLLGPGSGGGGDDPTDPNADLLATPGPDDDVGYDWPGEYAQRFDGVDKGSDTFDFQPHLTTEPTAPEGGTIVIRDSMALGPIPLNDGPSHQGWGPWEVNPGLTTEPTTAADFDNNGDVDGRDFLVWRKTDGDGGSIDALAVEPTTAADGSIPTETLSLNFDKINWRPMSGEDVDGLAVDPSNPNAEVRHYDFEFTMSKHCDKVVDDGPKLAIGGTGNGNPDSFDFQPQFTTDDGLLLPEVNDEVLVAFEHGEVADGLSNTFSFGERPIDAQVPELVEYSYGL